MRTQFALASTAIALLTIAGSARAQPGGADAWTSSDADAEQRAPPQARDDDARRRPRYDDPRDAYPWAPAARRSVPTLWAGVLLSSVALAGGFAGAFIESARNGDGVGARVALGS